MRYYPIYVTGVIGVAAPTRYYPIYVIGVAAPTRCYPIYVTGVTAPTRYYPIYVAGVIGIAGALQALQLLRAIILCTFKLSYIPPIYLQKFLNKNFS